MWAAPKCFSSIVNQCLKGVVSLRISCSEPPKFYEPEDAQSSDNRQENPSTVPQPAPVSVHPKTVHDMCFPQVVCRTLSRSLPSLTRLTIAGVRLCNFTDFANVLGGFPLLKYLACRNCVPAPGHAGFIPSLLQMLLPDVLDYLHIWGFQELVDVEDSSLVHFFVDARPHRVVAGMNDGLSLGRFSSLRKLEVDLNWDVLRLRQIDDVIVVLQATLEKWSVARPPKLVQAAPKSAARSQW
ncbi:uncharacterized protein BXZ73DRAFT_103039 [Epithele typhae]|uniref:uncharacterized protein n=1 Tax=Epithele typhae TaxID=378194 RepID=UPI0020078578|nr:uncharacterized protein BXZ73DRAFT_103039 [Epithele typhae]KAH9925865.1 hypothetical protein BXZ73DRAFT_103039 [Epithele typhae]